MQTYGDIMVPSPQECIDKLLADGSWVDDELPLRAYADSQNEFGVIVHIFNAAGEFQESMMFPNGPRSNVLQLVLVPGLHYDCALPLQHERPLHEVDGVAQGELVLLAPREAQSKKAAQKNVLSFSQEVPAPCAEEAEEPAGKHACAGKRPFATHSAPKLDASTRVPAPMRTDDFKGGSILVLPPKKQPQGTPQETRSFLHSWLGSISVHGKPLDVGVSEPRTNKRQAMITTYRLWCRNCKPACQWRPLAMYCRTSQIWAVWVMERQKHTGPKAEGADLFKKGGRPTEKTQRFYDLTPISNPALPSSSGRARAPRELEGPWLRIDLNRNRG